MHQEDAMKILIEQMQESLHDYRKTVNWKDRLCRLHELRSMNRLLKDSIERLENKVRVDFHNQTGLRASGDIWKRLAVEDNRIMREKRPQKKKY